MKGNRTQISMIIRQYSIPFPPISNGWMAGWLVVHAFLHSFPFICRTNEVLECGTNELLTEEIWNEFFDVSNVDLVDQPVHPFSHCLPLEPLILLEG